MKCKNCGAELNNGRCEYCGSFFVEDLRMLTLKPPKIDEDLLHKMLILKGNCDKVDDSRMEKVEVTCLGDTEPHFIEGWKYV